MLKKFEVKNYKNFNKEIEIDFTKVGGYKFNEECVTNNLISKMVIYGRNATGKSNLSRAILDIQDNIYRRRVLRRPEERFINANVEDVEAEFVYTFKFGNDELIYLYKKSDTNKLSEEKIIINNEICFYYNFKTSEADTYRLDRLGIEIQIFESFKDSLLNVTEAEEEEDTQVKSFIGWLLNFSIEPIVVKFKEYIDNMMVISPTNSVARKGSMVYRRLFQLLSEEGELNKFEDFLNYMGVTCQLVLKKLPEEEYQLYFNYKKLLPFIENASSGTLALVTLYQRLEFGKKASLIFLDEFDAFYHYEMSVKVVEYFKSKYSNYQIVMTTHNTNLMNNRLMRPDCLFILSQEGKLTAVCDATERELREGHNLEKMFISGEFEAYE